MKVRNIYLNYFGLVLLSIIVLNLSACNTFTRLSEVGKGPKNTEIITQAKNECRNDDINKVEWDT